MHADCNSSFVYRFGTRKHVGPVQPSEDIRTPRGVDVAASILISEGRRAGLLGVSVPP